MGLRAAWREPAFRQEAITSLLLTPLALWLGQSWIEIALLVGCLIFLLVVELLNTAIETAINRVGTDWNELSKLAKDLGSAAVLLSLLLALGIWAAFLYHRF